MPDDTKLSWGYYDVAVTIALLRQWALGDFSEGWSDYRRFPLFRPEDLSYPLAAAEALHCSADYLLGLTDDLHPLPAAYIPGDRPNAPTHAIVLLDYGEEVPLHLEAEWDGREWSAAGSIRIEEKVLAWYPLPPVPKVSDLQSDEAETDVPDDVNDWGLCATGLSPDGACRAAACCGEIYECCAQCGADCNIRCGWIPEEAADNGATD